MPLEHLFTAVFEQSPLPMMVLAPPEYRCTLTNPALRKLLDSLGQSPSEGHPITETWAEAVVRQYRSELDRVCQTGQPHSVTSPTMQAEADGRPQERFRKFGFHPVFGARKRVESILVIGEDITEKILLDRRLEKADQLQALLNSMVHITGTVSVVRDITEQKRLQDAEIN
ncbi:MAG: PAS domain-containing protein, partial [Bacillota bacterium]|nr:PAS domain-containing protein [Bacillota bacterium]